MNRILVILTLISLYALPLAAGPDIAVVKSRYDNIELVLSTYRIPYDLIDFSALGNDETFRKYNAIFFPSGLSSEYENNINVNWEGKDITSVTLSKKFFELDQKQFNRNLRNFIKRGGSAYFSGYAYKELSKVYDYFEFFDNFPFMGIPGRLEATVYDDLVRFSLKRKIALYMEYPGWITLKDVDHADVLSEASFDTPRGEKSGPISVLIKDGKGEIIYTSYYSTVYSEFKRFNILRVAGNMLCHAAVNSADEFFQDVTGKITDTFISGETVRTYYFDLKKGINTLHFLSQHEPYMFEVYDNRMSLIASVEKYELAQTYTISALKDDYCFVSIYPAGKEKSGMYAIVSANGTMIPKPVKTAVKVLLYTLGLIFAAAFIKVVISRLR